MTTLPLDTPQPSQFGQALANARAASPLLFNSALFMLALWLGCSALELVDHRLINGVSVWVKPAKFFLSLAVHLATVAWALSLLTPQARATRGMHGATRLIALCAWAEMAYIMFRAARGEASHFNQSSILAQVAYSVMGAGAVTITMATAAVGIKLLRSKPRNLWTEAAGLGLVLGAVLGTLAGIYVSQQTGHWVGGDQTDASGTGFFHWSTTGGDLRVAHFVGLHACQLVPLAALSGRRSIVWGSAAAITLATLFTFAQAVMGIPLFRQ